MKGKPRDPFVQHLLKKKQGAHGKSKKALRAKDKLSLKKLISDSSNELISSDYLL